MNGRPTWVVIPALDEAATIERCLDALRFAAMRAPGPVQVVVVDDRSGDQTAALAASALEGWGAGHAVLSGLSRGVGWARRVGFEHALGQVDRAPGRDALVATTDADSHVDVAWLQELHAVADQGAGVIAGDVVLDPATDARLVAARHRRLVERLARVRHDEPRAAHPHFAGSNLAFSAAALRQLQPLPVPEFLEDAAILDRCRELGLPIVRHAAARVYTSARTVGRAPHGLAAALAVDLHALSELAAVAEPAS